MGTCEPGVGDDATGAGRCPASSELLALLGMGLTSSGAAKSFHLQLRLLVMASTGGEGATWLSRLPVKHLGSFAQLSHYQRSAGLGTPWFLGSILRKQHRSQLSPPRDCGALQSPRLCPGCSVCFLTPLPIPVWISAA